MVWLFLLGLCIGWVFGAFWRDAVIWLTDGRGNDE